MPAVGHPVGPRMWSIGVLPLLLFAATTAAPDRAFDRWEWAWVWPGVEGKRLDGSWRRVADAKRPYDEARIGPLLPLSDGALLVGIDAWKPGDGSDGSLWQFRRGAFKRAWPFVGPGAPVPTCLLECPAGRLWVGTTEGLWVQEAGNWTGLRGCRGRSQIGTQPITNLPVALGGVTSIAAEDEQTVWLTTQRGLLVRVRCSVADAPDRWMAELAGAAGGLAPQGPADASFAAVISAADSSLWALRSDRILYVKTDTSEWKVASASLHLRDGEQVASFFVDRQRRAWIGTKSTRGGRVLNCVNGDWTTDRDLTSATAPFSVTGFSEAPDGRLAVVTGGVGLLVRDGDLWRPHAANVSCPHILVQRRPPDEAALMARALGIDELQVLLRDQVATSACWTSDGALWVGGRGQLTRLGDGR